MLASNQKCRWWVLTLSLVGAAAGLSAPARAQVPDLVPPAGGQAPQPVGPTSQPIGEPTPQAIDSALPAEGSGVEVLTRGPVHEGFAEPVEFDPRPGPIVTRRPPEPVEELPPDQRPEGEDVEWIPGYWSWDDPREDFLWVSGIWRRLPPGRQWVPGYWATVDEGFQWVSGFWASTEQTRIDYLPQPPATLEAGPNMPAPAEDQVWSPGYWSWYEERYVWRPGTWIATDPHWIWVPPSYLATPGGCVFVPGYWDYILADRGMMFAPVYIPPTIYTAPAFVYQPQVVINTTIITEHFFVRPGFRHYYFGDYYAANYRQQWGFLPWFSFQQTNIGYDPIYAWSAVHYGRRNPGWATHVRESYHHRVEHVTARPAPTFLAQQRLLDHRRDLTADRMTLAHTLTDAATQRETMRLVQVDQTRRTALEQRQQSLVQYRELRARREVEARAQPAQAQAVARRIELPRSPLVARTPATPPLAGASSWRQDVRHGLIEQQQQQQAAARSAFQQNQANRAAAVSERQQGILDGRARQAAEARARAEQVQAAQQLRRPLQPGQAPDRQVPGNPQIQGRIGSLHEAQQAQRQALLDARVQQSDEARARAEQARSAQQQQALQRQQQLQHAQRPALGQPVQQPVQPTPWAAPLQPAQQALQARQALQAQQARQAEQSQIAAQRQQAQQAQRAQFQQALQAQQAQRAARVQQPPQANPWSAQLQQAQQAQHAQQAQIAAQRQQALQAQQQRAAQMPRPMPRAVQAPQPSQIAPAAPTAAQRLDRRREAVRLRAEQQEGGRRFPGRP